MELKIKIDTTKIEEGAKGALGFLERLKEKAVAIGGNFIDCEIVMTKKEEKETSEDK